MSWDETSGTCCDIARGLSVFGDKWTLQIMREISMTNRRFEDIQIQTGMSSNLLTMRLKRLEEDGLIERRRYAAHANRFEYHATQKGKELDGVLIAIRAWSLRWNGPHSDDEPAVTLVYKETGETIDALWQPPRNNRPFSLRDTQSTISQAFLDEREAKIKAFKSRKGKPEAVDPKPRSRSVAAKKAPIKAIGKTASPKAAGVLSSRRKAEVLVLKPSPAAKVPAKKTAPVSKVASGKKSAPAKKAAAAKKIVKKARAA